MHKPSDNVWETLHNEITHTHTHSTQDSHPRNASKDVQTNHTTQPKHNGYPKSALVLWFGPYGCWPQVQNHTPAHLTFSISVTAVTGIMFPSEVSNDTSLCKEVRILMSSCRSQGLRMYASCRPMDERWNQILPHMQSWYSCHTFPRVSLLKKQTAMKLQTVTSTGAYTN